MTVLVTGSTGLLGGALVDLLVSEGHKVRCMLRRGSPNMARLNPERVEIVHGDATEVNDLVQALSGIDTFLHVAGIEYTPQVLSAMQRHAIKRLIIVGSTSVHSAYEHRSGWRRKMETLVRESGLDWTIVRPTMIYGSELDKNMHKLLRFLDRSPVYPMFGPGTNLWQPVYYKDLALGIVAAVETPEAIHQSYDLPGAEPLEYLDLVKTAARALGRKPRIIRLPLDPVRRTLNLAELTRLPLPIKSEQVMRLNEDKAYPYEEACRDLDYAPMTFQEGIMLEVARLRKIGLVKP